MAKYKHYDLNQTKMIPLCYADQIVEGSFEYALGATVEKHLDFSSFEQRYTNDETGRPAYNPRVLRKVVLYGYYKGIISSRALAERLPTQRRCHGVVSRDSTSLHHHRGLREQA